VTFLDAVRGPLAGEIVPLDRAGKAAALARGRDIDGLHAVERGNVDHAADCEIAGRTSDFAHEPLRFAIGLGEELDSGRSALLGALAFEFGNVTSSAAIGQTAGLVGEAQLDGLVTVALHGANLQHVARPGLNHRDRHDLPRLVVELCHPDLAAEYS